MRPSAEDLDLLRGLVEIPSLSRREGEAVEWLVARMAERGFRASVDDAGNGVQAMNVALGLPEDAGLGFVGLHP